jgi:hypothetical protein
MTEIMKVQVRQPCSATGSQKGSPPSFGHGLALPGKHSPVNWSYFSCPQLLANGFQDFT